MIRLAGCMIEVQAVFPETKDFCRDYLCGGTPDVSVRILKEDIEYERRKADRHMAEALTDVRLETSALQRKIANALAPRRTLLLHGSAVSADGCGYVFSAPSGTGKSTHVRFWREMLEIYDAPEKLICEDVGKVLSALRGIGALEE